MAGAAALGQELQPHGDGLLGRHGEAHRPGLAEGGVQRGADPELFEVDAEPVSPNDYVRFEVNPTDATKSLTLDTAYVDVNGQRYCGATQLAPYTSLILLKGGEPCPSVPDGGFEDGVAATDEPTGQVPAD